MFDSSRLHLFLYFSFFRPTVLKSIKRLCTFSTVEFPDFDVHTLTRGSCRKEGRSQGEFWQARSGKRWIITTLLYHQDALLETNNIIDND